MQELLKEKQSTSTYKHESRHIIAQERNRNHKGQFLSKQNKDL